MKPNTTQRAWLEKRTGPNRKQHRFPFRHVRRLRVRLFFLGCVNDRAVPCHLSWLVRSGPVRTQSSFSVVLLRKRNVDGYLPVCLQEVAIDALDDALGGFGDALVLELDLALADLVVSGANIAVHDLEGKDHVVEGGDVEVEGFVPHGIEFALLGGRILESVVLVAVMACDGM